MEEASIAEEKEEAKAGDKENAEGEKDSETFLSSLSCLP